MELQWLAVMPDDESFLFDVYAGTRSEEIAAWGWDALQQQAFLRMQFDMQRRSYAMQYGNMDHYIISRDGERMGQLRVVRNGGEILLVDIALLPEFRNAGHGTTIIKSLQQEAADAGVPLVLSALAHSAARKLYERLGFQAVEEHGMHVRMTWVPERGKKERLIMKR